jgi:hypothetical protein
MHKLSECDYEQVLEEYTKLLEQGTAPPIDEFLKQHPEQDAELRPRLEAVRLLIETKKELPPMPEALKEKLHTLFWQKMKEREKARLLEVQKELDMTDMLPVKRGIEYLVLLLHTQQSDESFRKYTGTSPVKKQIYLTAVRGITRIMKLLFLLGKEGKLEKTNPAYYQFVPYKIGPFAVQVYEDMKLLMELGFVERQHFDREGLPVIYTDDTKIDEGFRFNDVTTIYYLTDIGNKYAEKLAKSLKTKESDKISKIKAKYAPLSLKALLSYIYQRYPEYTVKSEVLEQILE